MSGGESPVRVKMNSYASASAITDSNIKTDSILTDTSVVYEGNFHEVVCTPSNGSNVTQTILFDDVSSEPDGFKLHEGEGIAVRLGSEASIGSYCYGSIWWDEVPK